MRGGAIDLAPVRRSIDNEQVATVDHFEDIYHQHHLAALRLATLLTGSRDAAEDVVAEVFARVYVACRRQPLDNPVAYVRRAVANQVASGFRRQAIVRRHDRRERRGEATEESGAARSADHAALIAALQQLPARHRVPVVLRYFEDLSEAQTAEVMGVPVGTVKSAVSRGLGQLRTLLDEEWT